MCLISPSHLLLADKTYEATSCRASIVNCQPVATGSSVETGCSADFAVVEKDQSPGAVSNSGMNLVTQCKIKSQLALVSKK